jgi:Predicted transcriptional regulator containing an HTH domain and an uncharacterized domain shared with the mammalian protein Schlafen
MDIRNSELSIETFNILVKEQVSEDNKIEFKNFQFPDGKLSSEQKEKLEKEIAAFANADGGTIFIGIDESKDKVASKVVGVGCGIAKFDEIQLAIQSRLLAKVRPRVYGIIMQRFELSDGNMVMTISVPKSISRPHAVNDGNKDTFYIRHSNGVTNMSLDDLRREILLGSSYQTEIKHFKQDRIAMILNDEYIQPLQNGAKLALHIIPLWSMEFGNLVDLGALDSWVGTNPFKPMSGDGYNTMYCADGRLSFSISSRAKGVQSSVLVMRNGIIEVIEIRMMNFTPGGPNQIYKWIDVENMLLKNLRAYSGMLERLNVPKPWYVSAAVVNGKGFRTDNGWGESEELYSNLTQAVDCIWNEGEPLNKVVEPCFDSLANAFGYSKSGIDFSKND